MKAARLFANNLIKASQGQLSLRGRRVVVKLGGSVLEDADILRETLDDLSTAAGIGVRIAVVHGGGKAIDRAMTTAGIVPRKINGRRVTDEATLAVVEQVLTELCFRLTDELRNRGRDAWAIHPITAANVSPLRGERMGDDLGWVGEVNQVDGEIARLLDARETPVIPSLALDANGHLLNVNADTAAAAVATAIGATRLVFLTDAPGILANRADSSTLISQLDVAGCRRMIDAGTLDGGMLPKIDACFASLRAGVGSVRILDGRQPRVLLRELLSDEPAGTALVLDAETPG